VAFCTPAETEKGAMIAIAPFSAVKLTNPN